HLGDVQGTGKRNHVSPRRDRAGTGEVNKWGSEIEDEETDHPEHDHCIDKAHHPSGRAPAAFDRIGNIWIEAVDRDVHLAGSSSTTARPGPPDRPGAELGGVPGS